MTKARLLESNPVPKLALNDEDRKAQYQSVERLAAKVRERVHGRPNKYTPHQSLRECRRRSLQR